MRITICHDDGRIWATHTIDAASGSHLRAALDPTFTRPTSDVGSDAALDLKEDLVTMCRNMATDGTDGTVASRRAPSYRPDA